MVRGAQHGRAAASAKVQQVYRVAGAIVCANE